MDLLDSAGDLSQRVATKRRTTEEFPVTEDGRLDLSRLIDVEAGLVTCTLYAFFFYLFLFFSSPPAVIAA